MSDPFPKRLNLFTDAAMFGGRTGAAGVGFTLLHPEGHTILKGGQFVGYLTCNEAEIAAVEFALSTMQGRLPMTKLCDIHAYTDSMVARIYLQGHGFRKQHLIERAESARMLADRHRSFVVDQVGRDVTAIRTAETQAKNALAAKGYRVVHRAKKGGRRKAVKPAWNPYAGLGH